jgi:regulator of protease activity HflC (stomatin/prohibitin superfamily)
MAFSLPIACALFVLASATLVYLMTCGRARIRANDWVAPVKVACLAILFGSFFFITPIHMIEEGHVGVVYRFKALSKTMLKPGLNFVAPIDEVFQIQVTQQTDSVLEVFCGTKDGVPLTFPRIEVVNQLAIEEVYNVVQQYGVYYDQPLIFAKIQYEMNQHCSKHTVNEVHIDTFDQLDEMLTRILQESLDKYAKGVRIHAVRLTKATLPQNIAAEYEKIVQGNMELLALRTKQEKEMAMLYAESNRTVALLEANRTRALARLDSEKQQEVERIRIDTEVKEAQLRATQRHEFLRIESQRIQELASIAAKIEITNATMQADLTAQRARLLVREAELEIERKEILMEHERQVKYAEAQAMLLTPNYVAIEMSRHLASNTKVYWGEKLPSMNVGVLPMAIPI